MLLESSVFVEEFLSCGIEDTLSFGKTFSKNLFPGSVVAFFGELGVGKTTLIKAMVQGLSVNKNQEITSPTFTYMHQYEAKMPIFHFDLYRLKGEKDFLELGFDEYFYQDGVCLIEWSEKIPSLLPTDTFVFELSHQTKTSRHIKVSKL